jgi:hypothetical protein
MNKTKIQILLVFTVLMLVSLACGGTVSTAKISNAYLTANSDGSDETTVFSPSDTFHAIVELKNAPDDTTLKAIWIAVDVPDVDPDYVIEETSTTSDGNDVITFDLSNDATWPTGSYKVDIYMNDKLERTLEFTVE